MEDIRPRKWFMWGMILASVPTILMILSFVLILPEISNQKQTGLGAIAGGLTEVAATAGLAVMFLVPVSAIVLLAKSFSKGHGIRSLIAGLSIAWSAVVLSGYCVMVWAMVRAAHR
jgi:hypothetical protein